MEHILSLSYGKDSLACLGAIEQLGWPLDRIVHAEVWATDTIPADLPPMVEFKFHEITNAEWAAIALWCHKNGTEPKGNNDYGKDASETLYWRKAFRR